MISYHSPAGGYSSNYMNGRLPDEVRTSTVRARTKIHEQKHSCPPLRCSPGWKKSKKFQNPGNPDIFSYFHRTQFLYSSSYRTIYSRTNFLEKLHDLHRISWWKQWSGVFLIALALDRYTLWVYIQVLYMVFENTRMWRMFGGSRNTFL